MTQCTKTQGKRPDWDTYYIGIAQAVSTRSTCIRRRYGSVIVRNNTIVSTGYNGSARGMDNCTDHGTCKREELGVPPGERYELCVAVHAEANAIINASVQEMDGATIYVAGTNSDGTRAGGHPCPMCMRMVRNAQIGKVIYLDERGEKKVF